MLWRGAPTGPRGVVCAPGPTASTIRHGGKTSLVVLAVLMLAACGRSGGDQAGTPGYSGEDRAVDRSPFEMAGPSTTAGPTTIPTDPTSSRRTTTTSTTLPERVPGPRSDDPVCKAFFIAATAVKEAQRAFQADQSSPGSVSYASVRTDLAGAFDRAADVAGDGRDTSQVVDVPTALHRRLRASARFVLTTTSFDDGGEILVPLIVTPPEAGEPVGWPEIEAVLSSECPELISALTGNTSMS